MKKFILFLIFINLTLVSRGFAADAIIVDHQCTDITSIPQTAIEAAKSTLHIAYGHTSHGSQLISGMGSSGTGLDNFMQNAFGTPAGLYVWHDGPETGALDLDDYFVSGDLGSPDRYTWAERTREYLNNPANADVNVVIWSWCGQADTSIENIDIYLNLMEDLIADYPNVQFVFMTGHLTGSGSAGQLNLANEHIREHCSTHGRILFDFADIESYDPAWLDPSWSGNGTNYMELMANDGCWYDSDGNGSRDSNWAQNWQAAHTQDTDWWASGAAHSENLNGNLKGYAAWWLWARLAGWNQCTPAPTDLTALAGTTTGTVDLAWTDNSENENSFIVQARYNSGAWDNAYATLSANTTSWTDNNNGNPPLDYGTYTYRVVARRDDGGTGSPCDSFASNTAEIEIINPDIPTAPSSLSVTINTADSTVELSWSDNSNNETHFIVQRKVDDGEWDNDYDTVTADTASYTDDNNDSPPLASGTYIYRVAAANSTGLSDSSNEDSAVLSTSPPQAPTDLASSASNTNVTLTWQDNSSDENYFIIERQRNSLGFSEIATLSADTEGYEDSELTPDNTYTYRVKATNGFGDSDWSNETSEYVVNEEFTIILRLESEIDDSFLDSNNPDTNYGQTPYPGSLDRYVARFNIPEELEGMYVLNATVSFFGWGSNWPDDQYLTVYPVTSAWTEDDVTWNSWQAPGGDYDGSNLLASVELSSGSDHDFYPPCDITSIVRKWVNGTTPNNGIILINDTGISTNIKATEYSPNSCTYFTIIYTLKPPTKINMTPILLLLLDEAN